MDAAVPCAGEAYVEPDSRGIERLATVLSRGGLTLIGACTEACIKRFGGPKLHARSAWIGTDSLRIGVATLSAGTGLRGIRHDEDCLCIGVVRPVIARSLPGVRDPAWEPPEAADLRANTR